MIRVTYRRPDDTDEQWERRRQLAPLRGDVRRAHERHVQALDELRKYAWRARFVTVGLVTGVTSLLGIAAVITLERWFNGFSWYLGLLIPIALVTLAGGLLCTDEYEKRADRRSFVARTGYEYQEAYVEYVDAGGGAEAADALLLLPGKRRS